MNATIILLYDKMRLRLSKKLNDRRNITEIVRGIIKV